MSLVLAELAGKAYQKTRFRVELLSMSCTFPGWMYGYKLHFTEYNRKLSKSSEKQINILNIIVSPSPYSVLQLQRNLYCEMLPEP